MTEAARAVARDLARLLVQEGDTENEIYHFLSDEIAELGGGRVAVVMFRLRHVEAEDEGGGKLLRAIDYAKK